MSYVCSAYGGQKRVLNFLELEFGIILGHLFCIFFKYIYLFNFTCVSALPISISMHVHRCAWCSKKPVSFHCE